MKNGRTLAITILFCSLFVSQAWGQNSSLFGDSTSRRPLALETDSFYYLSVEPPRQAQVHDLITVLVDLKSQVITDGEVDRRTQSNVDFRLRNWLKLDGFGIKRAPMIDGEPRARGAVNSQLRSEASIESSEGLKSQITTEIVDIRPNGLLVLEGHSSVKVNDELWELSLSGIVRPDDVLPNNTVLSRHVFDLRIHKQEKGHVWDGYRRGWLLKGMDYFKPF